MLTLFFLHWISYLLNNCQTLLLILIVFCARYGIWFKMRRIRIIKDLFLWDFLSLLKLSF